MQGSESWLDNPYAYDQAVQAAQIVLESLRPEGEVTCPGPPELQELGVAIGRGIANGITEELATGSARTIPSASEAADKAVFMAVHLPFGRWRRSAGRPWVVS